MKKFLLLLTVLLSFTVSAQEPAVTVTPSTSNMTSVNAYNKTFTLTGSDSQAWTVSGFSNYNLGWATNPMRCGSNKSATNATITTQFAISETIDKITCDVVRLIKGANDKITSIKVLVSPDNTFSTSTEYLGDINEIPATKNGTGTVTINITSPAANQYYRIAFQMAAATNSGWLAVNTINYYSAAEGEELGTVATPSISPADGSKLSVGDQITLDCATEDVTIYYTTNGDTPTTSSEIYVEPIIFYEPCTVKAIAVKDGYKNSDVATATYSLYEEGETTVTFDFTATGNAESLANTTLIMPSTSQVTTDFDGVIFKNGPIVFTASTANHSKGTSPRWYYYGAYEVVECRVYKDNEFKIYLDDNGYKITKIKFTQHGSSKDWEDMTVSEGGTWTNSSRTWEASTNKTINLVSFIPTGTCRFATLNVTYVDCNTGVAGIDKIDSDNSNSPVEYFNIQGLRIDGNQLTPGLYIRRQGTKTSKVIVL